MNIEITDLKKQISSNINKLSYDKLVEVKDFISILSRGSLRGKHSRKPRTTLQKLDIINDPIVQYIGSINSGSLAKNIDTELYGKSL